MFFSKFYFFNHTYKYPVLFDFWTFFLYFSVENVFHTWSFSWITGSGLKKGYNKVIRNFSLEYINTNYFHIKSLYKARARRLGKEILLRDIHNVSHTTK